MPKLREAKIIIPLLDNHGNSLIDVIKGVGKRLQAAYGGVTWSTAQGDWTDPEDGKVYDEDVAIFIVAVPEDEGALGNEDCQLCQIAHYARVAGGQEAIYVQFPDGEVQFVRGEALDELEAAE